MAKSTSKKKGKKATSKWANLHNRYRLLRNRFAKRKSQGSRKARTTLGALPYNGNTPHPGVMMDPYGGQGTIQQQRIPIPSRVGSNGASDPTLVKLYDLMEKFTEDFKKQNRPAAGKTGAVVQERPVNNVNDYTQNLHPEDAVALHQRNRDRIPFVHTSDVAPRNDVHTPWVHDEATPVDGPIATMPQDLIDALNNVVPNPDVNMHHATPDAPPPPPPDVSATVNAQTGVPPNPGDLPGETPTSQPLVPYVIHGSQDVDSIIRLPPAEPKQQYDYPEMQDPTTGGWYEHKRGSTEPKPTPTLPAPQLNHTPFSQHVLGNMDRRGQRGIFDILGQALRPHKPDSSHVTEQLIDYHQDAHHGDISIPHPLQIEQSELGKHPRSVPTVGNQPLPQISKPVKYESQPKKAKPTDPSVLGKHPRSVPTVGNQPLPQISKPVKYESEPKKARPPGSDIEVEDKDLW